MEEKKQAVSMSFDPEAARAAMEEKRAKAEANKLILQQMKLAVGCEEMDRIVKDILVPEFLKVVHAIRDSGGRAEVVAYDAENPIYEGEMCDIGMKFRCGDRNAPCKIEFIADPNEHEFSIEIREPNGDITENSWVYARTIPRNISQMILDFMDKHFPDVRYKPVYNEFDQYDYDLQGPFKVQMEEEGSVSELASTDTMEEAIKMGASFAKMFKGKPLTITDVDGNVIC